MKSPLFLFLALAIIVSAGCAARNISTAKPRIPKKILDITLNENSQSVILAIKGTQALTFTSDSEREPKGIYFSFPGTSADNVVGRFIPPKNDIINFIRVENFVEDETPLTIVFVALIQDAIYEVISDKNNILIYFTKKEDVSDVIEAKQEPTTMEPAPKPEPIPKSLTPASELIAVTTQSIEKSMTITLEADGTINNYKTFKLNNPNRIVFDLYNLKSRHRNQQIIEVQSELVRRIRHYGHPDKLRLVIDSRNNRILESTSESTNTGLTILITPP